MEEKEPQLHAIMISLHLQGHIIPFVNLAIKVASKGIRVTFVHTEDIHLKITKTYSKSHNNSGTEEEAADDIFGEARKAGLDIIYATISDGLPLEFDRDSNPERRWELTREKFPILVDEFVGKLVNSEPSSSFFLIADTFYYWPPTIADEYNLINVSFWTEPALIFTLCYHLDLLVQNGHFATQDNRKDAINYIPGVQEIEPKDLPWHLQAEDITTWSHRMIYKAFEEVKKADFILCNTAQELENDAISALHQKQPFYAIGPIFPPEFTKRRVATSLWSESNCTDWLNIMPRGSVLFVSFGSLAHLSKHLTVEIADGLLHSGVRFVWVIRPGMVCSNDADILPSGFEEEIKGRGIIVPWCNQMDVISHPAIGGFLTHCGWNSVLESIWCTIPLLCSPLSADQFTNRKLVVDDWKIGINLFKGDVVTRDEVAQNIKLLMTGETYEKLHNNIKKLKTTLGNALATNGSSEENLDQFIWDLKGLLSKGRPRGVGP